MIGFRLAALAVFILVLAAIVSLAGCGTSKLVRGRPSDLSVVELSSLGDTSALPPARPCGARAKDSAIKPARVGSVGSPVVRLTGGFALVAANTAHLRDSGKDRGRSRAERVTRSRDNRGPIGARFTFAQRSPSYTGETAVERHRAPWTWCEKNRLGVVGLRFDGSAIAGWRNLAAHRAHNPGVLGSNPGPATGLQLNVASADPKCCGPRVGDDAEASRDSRERPASNPTEGAT